MDRRKKIYSRSFACNPKYSPSSHLLMHLPIQANGNLRTVETSGARPVFYSVRFCSPCLSSRNTWSSLGRLYGPSGIPLLSTAVLRPADSLVALALALARCLSSLALLCGPALWPSAAHSLGLWPLEMAGRDPGLVVCLCAARDSRSVSVHHRRLISRVDLLAAR
jgi:hypothetical protein